MLQSRLLLTVLSLTFQDLHIPLDQSPKLPLCWQCGVCLLSCHQLLKPKNNIQIIALKVKALGTCIHTELYYRLRVWVQDVPHKKYNTMHQSQSLQAFLFIYFLFKGECELNFSTFFPHDDCSCLPDF